MRQRRMTSPKERCHWLCKSGQHVVPFDYFIITIPAQRGPWCELRERALARIEHPDLSYAMVKVESDLTLHITE
jgi:hypothetical protein